MAREKSIKSKEVHLMTLHLLLDTLYPTLVIPQEIATLIQSWTGTIPGEFGNIKKGESFITSLLKEVVDERNEEIGYKGIQIEEEGFIYFKKIKGGGSFESPIITIQHKYIKEYLEKNWATPNTENEYNHCFVINLTISTQIIRKMVKKINAFVYERKEKPLNLSFQQAVKRRELYDDRKNLYPLGPWSLPRMENRILPSSFRITVDKSAICPALSCGEYFTEKELLFYYNLSPWYILQQTKAKAQNSSSCIY